MDIIDPLYTTTIHDIRINGNASERDFFEAFMYDETNNNKTVPELIASMGMKDDLARKFLLFLEKYYSYYSLLPTSVEGKEYELD
jgi:hypothetical protein